MNIIPLSDRQARIKDIHKMLLPEMVPDQLMLLGLTEADFGPLTLTKVRAHPAPGISLLTLLKQRANAVKAAKIALYSTRSSNVRPSQLDLLLDNLTIFEKQKSELLKRLPPGVLANEAAYQLIDRLIETTLQIGYSAGSNDSLALTDRYTDFGYDKKVSVPQSGGNCKASKAKPVKALVYEMANHIYQHNDLLCATKSKLAEAIHSRFVEFSDTANKNMDIEALQNFPNGAPEHDTIKGWLKQIKKPQSPSKQPKPSLKRLIVELKTAYKPQTMKQALKNKNTK